jgi:[ribosomal protein S18]-alanine N-acetyltransferase
MTPVVTLLDSSADLDALLEIDAESFLRPWTRAMYEAELRNPAVTRIFLIRTGDHVAGYCATWFLPGELHINNLAIRSAWRRQGLASTLLIWVLNAAREAGCNRATLEVRRSNDAARHLYEGLGFHLAGVRPNYYTDPVEDALILWRDPAESPESDKNG